MNEIENSADDLCQMFFFNSLDAIFLTTPDGTIWDANPAACKMFGRTLEEFCRLGREGIIDTTDPRLATAIEERNRTGKYFGELIGIKSDGSRFPVEMTSVFFNGRNSRIFISTIMRDVTERKKAEEALRRSELKYRRLHETIRDGFVFVAMTGEIKDSNEVYQKMVGYSNEDLRKLTYLDITPSKWFSFESRIVEDQVLIRGYSDIYEKEYIRKDGTVFPVELRTVLIKSEEGQEEGMWAIVRDITERKKVEEALKSSENQLRELNATKDKLFSIIAHDLRNPFTAIMGYSNILSVCAREKKYEEIIKFAGRIQESSQKSLRLLTNIMDWAGSQYNGMKFQPEVLNVVEMIKAVANLLNDSANQKKITVDLEMPPKLFWKADKHLISSTLSNLLSNAIKFSHSEGRIIITAGQEQDKLIVSVKDSGIGIRSEDLKKIFRIGESIQSPGAYDENGSGLGLILCREFIAKHGGEIWAVSDEGRGSTFFFSIPENLN